MQLIKANVNIDKLIQMQDEIDWYNILNYNNITSAELNKLCLNITNDNFWNTLSYSKINSQIDMPTLIKSYDKIIWYEFFDTRTNLSQKEIQYLCASINDWAFTQSILNSAYVKYISVQYLAQHQHDNCDIDWDFITQHRNFTPKEKKYLFHHIENSKILEALHITNSEVDVKALILNQNNVDWEEIFKDKYFSLQQLYTLCDNITCNNFWWTLYMADNFQQMDLQHVVKYKNTIAWGFILDTESFRSLTDEEIKYLCDNVEDEYFWEYITDNPQYVQSIDVKYINQYQENFDLYYVLTCNERKFSNRELEYLRQHIHDAKTLKIINTKLGVQSMSYKELISNKNAIDWDTVALEDLNLSETEKKMLLLNVTELSKKYSTDIQKDFSQIKNMPSKRFYTIGNNDMHRDRQGAFVIVKNANDTAEILIETNGSHYPMISYIAKKYGYSNDVINKLFEVEENETVVGNRLDLEEEEKQELQYAKKNLHCCCGYIHIDNNQDNPIAVIDARRIFNFSPQQVAKLLQGKTYDGKPLIAVGINDPGVSEVSFMKVASKKRLISYNYRIIYIY